MKEEQPLTLDKYLEYTQTNLIAILEILIKEKNKIQSVVSDKDFYIVGAYVEAIEMLQLTMDNLTALIEQYNDIIYYMSQFDVNSVNQEGW